MIKIAQGAVEQDAVIYTLTRFGLSKVANAMAGGAIGTALGAVGGYMSADENSSGWERAGRAALGAKVLGTVGGLGGHYVANRGAAAQVAHGAPQVAHGAPQGTRGAPPGAPAEPSWINDIQLSPERVGANDRRVAGTTADKPAQVGGAAAPGVQAPKVARPRKAAVPQAAVPQAAVPQTGSPQPHYADENAMLAAQGRLSKPNRAAMQAAFASGHVPNTEQAWQQAPHYVVATPEERAQSLATAAPGTWQHTFLSNYPGT